MLLGRVINYCKDSLSCSQNDRGTEVDEETGRGKSSLFVPTYVTTCSIWVKERHRQIPFPEVLSYPFIIWYVTHQIVFFMHSDTLVFLLCVVSNSFGRGFFTRCLTVLRTWFTTPFRSHLSFRVFRDTKGEEVPSHLTTQTDLVFPTSSGTKHNSDVCLYSGSIVSRVSDTISFLD